MYQMQGRVIHLGEVEHPTESMTKREFVLNIPDPNGYDSEVKFQCVNARVEELDKVAVGMEVAVNFVIRGNGFTSKKTGESGWYVNLNAINVTVLSGQRNTVGGSHSQPAPATGQAPAQVASQPASSADDVPF